MKVLIELNERALQELFGFKEVEDINDYFETEFEETGAFYIYVEKTDWGYIIYNDKKEFLFDVHYFDLTDYVADYLDKKERG